VINEINQYITEGKMLREAIVASKTPNQELLRYSDSSSPESEHEEISNDC